MKKQSCVVLLALTFAVGCATPERAPDIGALYSRSAQYHGHDRNPVIVIPGVVGSRLEDTETGVPVWGAFSGDYINPRDPEGARLAALPMKEGRPLRELRDTVVSTAALDRVGLKLLGLPLSLNAYANILQTLGAGGYRDEALGMAGAIDYGDDHFTCFQFHYDWRRSNVDNAQALHAFMLEKRTDVEAELQRRYGEASVPVQFDIVAHSMGGLIVRYLLRYGDQALPDDGSLPELNWSGAALVDRVVLVGTPSAGSVDVLQRLEGGLRLGPVAFYRPAIVGTFPSLYELMPRVRHGALVDASDRQRKLDFYDPNLWSEFGWGLASDGLDEDLRILLPEVQDGEERARIARDHLAKCLKNAKQFHQALDVPAEPPESITIQLIAGDAEQTGQVLSADSATGALRLIETAPGDGTVTRASALMDERVGSEWAPYLVSPIRWDHVTFLFRDHLGMTMDPMFAENVLYLLLEEPK